MVRSWWQIFRFGSILLLNQVVPECLGTWHIPWEWLEDGEPISLFFLCCWLCIGAQLEGATPHWAHLSATINNCPIPQNPLCKPLCPNPTYRMGTDREPPNHQSPPDKHQGEKERVRPSEGFLIMWKQPLKQTGLNISQVTALHGCVCCAWLWECKVAPVPVALHVCG